MDPCRQAVPASQSLPATCIVCGSEGRGLGEITLDALLRPAAHARRVENRHWFCATPSCPVVYFGRSERFDRGDIIVPVFEKENDAGCPVCYCFDVTENDIRNEVSTAGRSTASDRIKSLIRQGRCACELKRPQGSCCLARVTAIERRVTGVRER